MNHKIKFENIDFDAILCLNGEISHFEYINESKGRIYCADGAANKLIEQNIIPDYIIGDLDSINYNHLSLNYPNINFHKFNSQETNDFERLVNDKGIIRNKLKINAAIYNANAILKIQNTNGSFINWLKSNNSLTLNEWVKLFKKQFKFTGPEITNEFLMSTGTIRGAHTQECKIYNEILQLNPLWAEKESNKYY